MIDFNRHKKNRGIILIIVMMICLIIYSLIPSVTGKNKHENINYGSVEKKHHFAISTGTQEATEIGTQILKEGGNAVDAAIAVSFALGVSSPQNSGIGGGGVALVYDRNTDEAYYYDFYNSSGHTNHGNQIGIPGLLKGMNRLYEDYASLSVDQLMEYPIQLARQGFIIDEHLGHSIDIKPFVGEVNPAFIASNKVVTSNDILIQEDLAKTYEAIKNEGFDIMYDGVHEISSNFSNLSGIDIQSLMDYEVYKYDALETNYNGKTILSAGSPFSGTTLIQLLKLYEMNDFDLSKKMNDGSLMTYDSIYNYAFDNNHSFVGDTIDSRIWDPYVIEDDYLIENYTDTIIYDEDFDESENTISYSIMDDQGLVVIGTNTLSNHWGSLVSSDGYFFNNSLKNFSSDGVNVWEPMKRPKTFISPVIIYDESNSIYGVGSSGGNTIPQVISMIVSQKESGIHLQEAIDTQRISKDKNKYMIESKKTRAFERMDVLEMNWDLRYYAEGSFFSAVTAVSYEDKVFDAYYESVNCNEYCAASEN